MKKKLLIAVIYLSGCFCSYTTFKYGMTHRHGKIYQYTVGDRTSNLFVSAFSWIAFAVLVVDTLLIDGNSDAPANW
jgi:hypothetical protein